LALVSAVVLARGSSKRPLQVVPVIDLGRYAGQWYEIARFPNRFQKRCAGEVTATYALRPDGKISVLNQCRLEDGSMIKATGVARTVGEGRPDSILKVRFAPAFLSFIPQVWGDYQVIALSPDYTHAVVGDPARKYLWILSRSPQIDDAKYAQLVEQAGAQGFDVARLQKTRQM
jgi:apolipoprotein D and lipocalin family protein